MTTICDYCHNKARLVTGEAIYPHRPDLYELKFYYCADCQAWCGCHRGTTKPLGRLANAELRQARQNAHAAFDVLWRATTLAGSYSREGAYKWLARQLGVKRDDCHIGMMNVEQCQRVAEICQSAVQDREVIGK